MVQKQFVLKQGMRGSRNFRRDVQVSLRKKADVFFCFFFSPQLILQKSNGQFQRNLSFFKVQGSKEGSAFSGGGGGGGGGRGSNFFQGEGVQLLNPDINPYNLWFSRGGSGPPVPPSGSALAGFHARICIISVDNCYLKNTSKVMLYV